MFRTVLSPSLVGETDLSVLPFTAFLVGLRFFGLGVMGSSLSASVLIGSPAAFFLGEARFLGEGVLGSLMSAPPWISVFAFLEIDCSVAMGVSSPEFSAVAEAARFLAFVLPLVLIPSIGP